jgi:hypothetical protein
MKARTIHDIRMPSQDYDSITRMTDKEVLDHLNFVCKLSRKRVVPLNVRRNKFRVSRGTNYVTVHLFWDKKETCRVSFVPGPTFTRPG